MATLALATEGAAKARGRRASARPWLRLRRSRRHRDRPPAPRHGVDHSIAQIERARRNVPSGHFIHGDLAAPDLPRGSFDAVVSFYALEGIPRAEHAAVLQHAHDLLRPSGYLLLATEPMDRESVTGVYRGMRMRISGFDADTLLRIVGDASMSLLESKIETQNERSHDVPFLWILAQRD